MNRLQFIVGAILGLCLMAQSSWATKAYVTDSFKITLRTGPSIENKILSLLSSGQQVEILDTQGDWSQVRLLGSGESSKEGWILSRYLVTRLPWEMQAKSLQEENTRLKGRLTGIEQDLTEALNREKDVTSKLQGNAEALQKLEEEYESLKQGAAGYLKLEARHRSTRSTLETAQKELQRLSEENKELMASQRNRWFATGALVLLCGLMIGLLIGRQQRKRRSSIYY